VFMWTLITSLPVGCEVLRWACLFVREHIWKTGCQTSPVFVLVTCGRGLVLRRQRYDILCRPTSGFVDDVIFSHIPTSFSHRHAHLSETNCNVFARSRRSSCQCRSVVACCCVPNRRYKILVGVNCLSVWILCAVILFDQACMITLRLHRPIYCAHATSRVQQQTVCHVVLLNRNRFECPEQLW